MRNNIFTPHRATAKVNQVIFRYAIFGWEHLVIFHLSCLLGLHGFFVLDTMEQPFNFICLKSEILEMAT